MNLGRFQQGQIVKLNVSPFDNVGVSTVPDSAPLATIRDQYSNAMAFLKMPMNRSVVGFSIPVFLGVGFPLGTYTVTYSWSIGDYQGSASDSFDVISGGDIGGGVIAMYGYDRPEARYVVAQLSSGNLVQGRNPKF